MNSRGWKASQIFAGTRKLLLILPPRCQDTKIIEDLGALVSWWLLHALLDIYVLFSAERTGSDCSKISATSLRASASSTPVFLAASSNMTMQKGHATASVCGCAFWIC